MMRPPLLLHCRVRRADGRRLSLWLPICLLWVPLVLLALVLAPLLVLLVLLFAPAGRRRRTLLAGPAAFLLFCAARGLEIETGDGQRRVLWALA